MLLLGNVRGDGPRQTDGVRRRTRKFLVRTIRAVALVIRDGRIPRPIRWGGALGLLPIPGPFDEVVLVVIGGILWVFYRDRLTEAWNRAGAP